MVPISWKPSSILLGKVALCGKLDGGLNFHAADAYIKCLDYNMQLEYTLENTILSFSHGRKSKYTWILAKLAMLLVHREDWQYKFTARQNR